MALLLDIFEPEQIEHLIAQSTDVLRSPLNNAGFADYLWFCADGHRIQVERKQIDEILGGMDRVEEQLRRELQIGVEENILLYEGTFEPIFGLKNATQSWHMARDRRIMVPGHKYNVSYSGVQAWFSQLDKSGITIIHTFDYEATAITLVALYNNSQKEEHTTLTRYIKDRIYPASYNPHVLTLMGIKGVNLGEAKSKALVERYGTVWYILNQSPEDLAETIITEPGTREVRLGLTTSKKLLKAVGRIS